MHFYGEKEISQEIKQGLGKLPSLWHGRHHCQAVLLAALAFTHQFLLLCNIYSPEWWFSCCLSLSPRKDFFFFFFNARIPSLSTHNVLNFILFSFSVYLMCHGIIQRLPSTQPYRYKWTPNSITLDFLFLPSLALQSRALKTFHLTDISCHPQSGAPQLGCQIWTPCGVRHVLFLLLWLFGVDTQCRRHPMETLTNISGASTGSCCFLMFPSLRALRLCRAFSPLNWRKDPIPGVLPHLAWKSTPWVFLFGCCLFIVCLKLWNDGWPDFYHTY